MSPELKSLVESIERYQGKSLLPNDVRTLVYHFISSLGPEAIRECAGKDMSFKIGYVEGYCRHVANKRNT